MDYKKAYKELQKEHALLENRFKLALIGSNSGIWDWENLESDLYWWSDRIYEMLGYKPGEVEARISHWLDWTHPDDLADVREALDQHMKKGETYEVEFRMRKKNGDYIWVAARGESVRDDEGRPVRMTGSVADISARKAAEHKLVESEKKYRLLFENMTSGFALHEMIYDEKNRPIDYKYLEVNPAFETHTGLSPKKIIGKTVKELLPGIEEYWIQKYAEVAQTGKPLNYENYSSELRKHYGVYAYSPEKNKFAVLFHDITEQKTAQLALVNSEKQLKLIFDNSPAIMMLMDEELHILQMNKAGLEFAGNTLDNIQNKIGGDAFKCIYSLNTQEGCGASEHCKTCGIRNTIIDTIQNNRPNYKKKAELRIKRNGGEETVHVLISSVRAGEKPDSTYLISIDDVTDQRKAELALQDSLVKYKTLADHTYDWEYWKGADERYIYVSPSCLRITGYAASEFISNTELFHTILEQEDMTHWLKHEERSSNQQPCKYPVELRIRTKSGKVKWINHVCQPVYDQDGNYIGNRGTNRDITVQKLSQLALTESEMRFKELADLSSEGIVIHEKGVIMNINKALLNLTGYKEYELFGHHVNELFIPEPYMAIVSDSLKNKETPALEIEVRRKDGSFFPAELGGRHISKQERSLGVVSIRDISDQKEIQKKILSTIIQTEESERKRIAQDLHDGLGPVLSTVKLYTQTYISSDKPKFKKKIADQLLESIEEALTQVSEIAHNLSPHVLNDFGLRAAITSFIDKLKRVSDIEIEFISDLDISIKHEIETVLYRVAIELINNSLRHAEACLIEIRLQMISDYIVLNYSDNGIGFIPEVVRTEKNGMGLFNIESRVKSLGGTVQLNTEERKGVHYIIRIPVVPETNA